LYESDNKMKIRRMDVVNAEAETRVKALDRYSAKNHRVLLVQVWFCGFIARIPEQRERKCRL
jgi:hypothetical protein